MGAREWKWLATMGLICAVAASAFGASASASTMLTAPATNVGTAGGVLGTPDGAFAMTIPPNVLSAGYNLGILETQAAPSNAPTLPSDLQAVSQYFALSGYAMSAPQAATIKFNPAWLGSTPAAAVSVYAWQGGSSWQFQPTAVDAGTDSVQVFVPGPETVVVLVNRSTFSDVPATYWASNSIDAMLATGVMDGFGNGTFGPDQPVTRAEFAKMLTVALDLPLPSRPPSFSDVPAGMWYSSYVAAVAQAGLMTGETATTFAPNAPVPREELAVLLMRALKLQPAGGLGFTDAGQVAAWAVPGVEAAVTAGYMLGYPDGTFRPLAPVTRAQAATVLARVIAGEAP